MLVDLPSPTLPSWQELGFFWVSQWLLTEKSSRVSLCSLGKNGGRMRKEFCSTLSLLCYLPLKPPSEAVSKPLWGFWMGDARRREESGMAVAAGRGQKCCGRIIREAKTWAVEMC